MAAKKTAPLFISFAPDGSSSGIGPDGDHPFAFASTLLLRYRLVDGVVVDRFAGLTDEGALAKLLADEKAAAEEIQAATPFTIFKTTVIGRMSDEELTTFDAGYRAQDLRGRMMWDNCTSIVSTDPYRGTLKELFAAAYGEARADELLAPL